MKERDSLPRWLQLSHPGAGSSSQVSKVCDRDQLSLLYQVHYQVVVSGPAETANSTDLGCQLGRQAGGNLALCAATPASQVAD